MSLAALSASPSFAHIAQQTPAARRDPKAWETAKEFETQFLSSMTQSMFEGVKTDSFFGGGAGEDMFRSMLVGQYSKEMSNAGGIGIADKIYGEILKLQEHGR
jgi:Rod binding domain-containing protein